MDHGTSARGGVGRSTPARRVIGVRGGRSRADSVTAFPAMVSPSQPRPRPAPTEDCAPVTRAGSDTEIWARSIWLLHPGATTFQNNTEGADGSPTEEAKSSAAPVPPGSRTPGTR